jgi:FMN phosphatase YigB (HAD superfamily)
MRAVLFDLDGTLLDLDLRAFLSRYFAALEVASAPLVDESRGGVAGFMAALQSAVGAMMEPHEGRTNQHVFYERLLALTGVDLGEHWPVYERFYAEVFPTLRDTAGPADGGRESVETALELGLKVAIATNPIFPRVAIEQRIAWAGLDDLDLPVITTYEEMLACKPHPQYFRQTADLLGVAPYECLMVGDDRVLDLGAADVGMRTFYIGNESAPSADMQGRLAELPELLRRLA